MGLDDAMCRIDLLHTSMLKALLPQPLLYLTTRTLPAAHHIVRGSLITPESYIDKRKGRAVSLQENRSIRQRAHLQGEAPGRKFMQIQVLGPDYPAAAAVNLLVCDNVWCIALQQTLHLQGRRCEVFTIALGQRICPEVTRLTAASPAMDRAWTCCEMPHPCCAKV